MLTRASHHIEEGREDSTHAASVGSVMWGRLASVVGTLGVDVGKALATNITVNSGEGMCTNRETVINTHTSKLQKRRLAKNRASRKRSKPTTSKKPAIHLTFLNGCLKSTNVDRSLDVLGLPAVRTPSQTTAMRSLHLPQAHEDSETSTRQPRPLGPQETRPGPHEIGSLTSPLLLQKPPTA